jgi:hypothetical protein
MPPDSCSPPPRISPLLLVLLSGVLFALAILWTARGTAALVAKNNLDHQLNQVQWMNAVDLRGRWVDQQYIYNGQNPYDVLLRTAALESGKPPPVTTRNATVIERIGSSRGGGYPPWAFFSGVVFTGLPWRVMQRVAALYDLIALAVIAWYAWSESRICGKAGALFLTAGSLAIAGNLPAFFWGQYGIIVVALLVGAAMVEKRGYSFLAGIVLGISLLKPNISAPFCICYLVQRRYRVLFGAGVYLLVSSAVIWIVTKTNPIEMIHQMQQAAELVVGGVAGPLHWILDLGVPIHRAIVLLAVTVIVAGSILMFYFRRESLLTQYAIAALTARLWTYHRPTDNIMMMPLLLAVGIAMLRRENIALMVAFALAGLALWIPFTYHRKNLIIMIECVAWGVSIAVLLMQFRNREHDDVCLYGPHKSGTSPSPTQ